MIKTAEQISKNMRNVRNKDSAIELTLRKELWKRNLRYGKNVFKIFGKPDIVFSGLKIAIFVDSEFWHGYDWQNKQFEIKSNRDFWIPKIERNIQRDIEVTQTLQTDGWTVIRVWGNDIKRDVVSVADRIESIYKEKIEHTSQTLLKTIDLCAGIGGIRKGFEMTGAFQNIIAAEIDRFACMTYAHLQGEDANHDLTSEDFKVELEQLQYDVLLAGFPCQTFSKAGLEEGFKNKEKGIIFSHIADIIKRTRPRAVFLENVDNLVRHDKGNTFRIIIETLEKILDYKVIGVTYGITGELIYKKQDFIRNSRYFGIPQNRPRTYIMAFDRKRYGINALLGIENYLPEQNDWFLYDDLNELIEFHAEPKYYMASGYLDTLVRHKEREHNKGNGFGYKVVNASGIAHPVANTIMAIGGSGKERNLVYDPQEGIAGMILPPKKHP